MLLPENFCKDSGFPKEKKYICAIINIRARVEAACRPVCAGHVQTDMMMMKRILFFVCFAVLSLEGMQAQSADRTPAGDPYAVAVARVMELTNVRQSTLAMLESVYVQMRGQLGCTEPQARELAAVVLDAMYDGVVEMYVPIYRKYYTLDELTQLCAFYETPLGRKVARVTPLVTQEGLQNMGPVQQKAGAAAQRYLEKIR